MPDSPSPATKTQERAVPGTRPPNLRCIACRFEYWVDPAYNMFAPCPRCQSTMMKELISADRGEDLEAQHREEVMQLHTAIELYKGTADQLRAQLAAKDALLQKAINRCRTAEDMAVDAGAPDYELMDILQLLEAAKDCSPDPRASKASTEGPQGGQP